MVSIGNINNQKGGKINFSDHSVNIDASIVDKIEKLEADAESGKYSVGELKARALKISAELTKGVATSLGARFIADLLSKM